VSETQSDANGDFFIDEPQVTQKDGTFSFDVPASRCTLVAGHAILEVDVTRGPLPPIRLEVRKP